MFKTILRASALLLLLMLVSCKQANDSTVSDSSNPGKLTANDAIDFVVDAEEQLAGLLVENERMAWVYSNFITQDTEMLAALANKKFTAKQVELAIEAARYYEIPELDSDTRRKLNILRSGITIPAPRDVAKTAEQSEIGAKLGGMYGKGEYCYEDGRCLDLGHLSDIMAESRDPNTLLEAWNGWRRVSPPMKDLYARQVELANEGAAELGFADLGTMWRSAYDMPPEDFPAELDRLWGEVKPLYEALHCHARARLGELYGTDLVPQDGPIPAHLLGNMWAQDWSNIYPLLAPLEETSSYDLTSILRERGFDAITMVEAGEAFFSSLGFEELPATFWERSLFVKPEDREVVCHASAWDVDEKDDLRIKMCIKVNAEDFKTIHHELGHNYYQRAYNKENFFYRSGANDGFHEAVGDTIALSITPEYLQKIGLLENVPDASGDLALLMKRALEGIAFLPFGLMVDQWRWQVFAGETDPDGYNDLWWQLREKYQGVKAPNERPADAFDAGAKYHVPGNTPYTRYFLARILQFQFHRSLCEIAGDEGPIHRCSIYGNKQAGQRLNAMLEMGRSKPWPDELEALTGQREMDATAMLDYFAPLQEWLDEQNQGRQCGW
ncbi:MAG: M2 family metallopeptidase [Xanthomonadales bacterium]|nr:M2 family metallopeptidase [Xanthomonadales bacterium]